MDRVLSCIDDAGMTLKLAKCEFFRKSVTYLGHIISDEGVRVCQDKVQAVQEFLTDNATELLHACFLLFHRVALDLVARASVPFGFEEALRENSTELDESILANSSSAKLCCVPS